MQPRPTFPPRPYEPSPEELAKFTVNHHNASKHDERIRRAKAAFAKAPDKSGNLPFINRKQERVYRKQQRVALKRQNRLDQAA